MTKTKLQVWSITKEKIMLLISTEVLIDNLTLFMCECLRERADKLL